MHKISITKFTEQTRKKEQTEGGKSGEKNHNEGYSVRKDKNSEQPPKDSTPWQHSPLMDHDQNHIHFPIYNEWTKTIPPTSDVEVVGLKPYNLSDILHILKELEYNLPFIPQPKGYYFIYCLYTCLSIGFAPPMLNAWIFIKDFERMWKIQDREFCEYLAYNIMCSYIIFNDRRGYGVLEHLMGCLGAYALRYYCKLEVAYNKYYLKHTMAINHKPIFIMAKEILY